MRRSAAALFVPMMAFLIWMVPASAQTMVEAGVAAGASSAASAGARGVGKSVSGVFKNLDKTLKSTDTGGVAKSSSGKSATRHGAAEKVPASRGLAAAESPKPSYEDAAQIQKGIGYEELTRRFGPPAMKFAGPNDTQTMSYMSPGGVVQVELQGGKVTSVAKTGA